MIKPRLLAILAMVTGALALGLATAWLARPTPAVAPRPAPRATSQVALPVPLAIESPPVTIAPPPVTPPAARSIVRRRIPRDVPDQRRAEDQVTVTTINSW